MTNSSDEVVEKKEKQQRREKLLWILSLAAAIIFFQGYMIAPLIPNLSEVFNVPEQKIGLIVPAYMIAYGISTLFYGLLSDWLGRGKLIRISLIAFIVLTALTATAQSASDMILWRLLTGLGASGVVPLSLAMIGDLYPFENRGRPLGLLFAAMEGGMAIGSTAGVVLVPFTGWRMLFLITAAMAAGILWILIRYLSLSSAPKSKSPPAARQIFRGYRNLLATKRGLRTYSYVFWNGIFHSAIYTWLGLYFTQRYDLGEIGIGLAILGYGIPGLLLGATIGKAADKWGRLWLIISGLGISAAATIVMIFEIPLLVAAVAVTLISLGYDLTQPLFAGIVTQLGGKKQGGQAMGLNVFTLFIGFGLGSLLFGEALRLSFSTALSIFAAVQVVVTLIAIPLFRSESPQKDTN